MVQLLKNIALGVVSVCVGILLVEGLSRAMYSKPWHQRLLDEQNCNSINSVVRTNKLGLRDKEYSDKKKTAAKRVLILGDSFTFGAGVVDDDAVFPELLEKKLNAEFSKAGTAVEVLNGGIPGSLTDIWVKLLLAEEKLFEPDTVLVVFFLRDGTRTASIGGFFGPIRDEIKARNERSLLYHYSYLFRLYQDTQDRTYLAEKYSKEMNDAYLGSKDQTQEWETAKANILRIKQISEQNKASVGLVVFPVLVELNNNYPFQQAVDLIVRFARENGIPTHDLLPAFMGKNGPDLWVSPFDQHPNAVAHKIAADSILPFLRQLLIVGR